MKKLYAQVIMPLPLNDYYTYSVPEAMAGLLTPGMRVVVQFGLKKFYTAIVASITENPPHGIEELKSVTALLEDTPVVYPINLALWEWIGRYYLASVGEVMKAALPAALKLESNTEVAVVADADHQGLTVGEAAMLAVIPPGGTTVKRLQQWMGSQFSHRQLGELVRKGQIEVFEKMGEKVPPRKVLEVAAAPRLSDPLAFDAIMETMSRAPAQRDLLMHFLQLTNLFGESPRSSVPKKELLKDTPYSDATVKQLIKKGLLVLHEARESEKHGIEVQSGLNMLNPFQQQALSEVKKQFQEKQVVLLHGITASGKTEIYFQLIDEACRKGQQVLYLVPEIALTPQITRRLREVFGNRVVVYHSKMSDRERVAIWNQVLSFDSENHRVGQIVLGARSAIFLPFKTLGLVVVDEEHEHSYKQTDPSPRYNARDMAALLGVQHKAHVIFGSATPSSETFLNTQNGKYGMVTLTQRHGDARLPDIVVADIQRAFKRRQMQAMLTPELYGRIKIALESKEQVILFQNRRGYSPYIECMSCGWIPRCLHCDVSLTYHRRHQRLHCHYCGFQMAMPEQCGVCSHTELKSRGMGTEKIEDEISKLFPEARLARVDLDTTRSRYAFDKLVERLEQRKIDIVVGTQMIAKGLDFSKVSLVGILNADNLINFPDYRAHERAFQLMMQVSGRSGRSDTPGTVVVQTSQPQHPVFGFLLEHNFTGYMEQLLEERRLFHYPPWYRMVRLTVKHRQQYLADSLAAALAEDLRKQSGFIVLGPEYPLVSRIKNIYGKEIWIKLNRNLKPEFTGGLIREAVTQNRMLDGGKSALYSIDVDPL